MEDNKYSIKGNEAILKSIEDNVEKARKSINKIEHDVKGKQIARKWITAFSLFGAWTLFRLVLVQYKNDFLVVITAFSLLYALVHYIFKPIIANTRKNGYRQLIGELTPEFGTVVEAIRSQLATNEEANVDFESIYIVNGERIDLNQDIVDIDLTQKMVYVYIVKSISIDTDIAVAAAKFTIHVLTKTPFHEL